MPFLSFPIITIIRIHTSIFLISCYLLPFIVGARLKLKINSISHSTPYAVIFTNSPLFPTRHSSLHTPSPLYPLFSLTSPTFTSPSLHTPQLPTHQIQSKPTSHPTLTTHHTPKTPPIPSITTLTSLTTHQSPHSSPHQSTNSSYLISFAILRSKSRYIPLTAIKPHMSLFTSYHSNLIFCESPLF